MSEQQTASAMRVFFMRCPSRIMGNVSLMILPGQEHSGLGRSDGQARPIGQFTPTPHACSRSRPVSPPRRSTVSPPQSPKARRSRSAGSHPSAMEAGARKSPGSVSDPGLSQVEMAGIEPASVGRLSGLLRAQFVKQFLRYWPLHEHMDQRTELSKSPSDTPNEYLKQWLPKRCQAPERKRLEADGFAARALSGSEGQIGAVVRLSTYCFAEDINEMTLPSRPASPDAVSNVETDHPHILLPNLPCSVLRVCGFLGWTGTPAYSVNAGRANRIPTSYDRFARPPRRSSRWRWRDSHP